MKPKRSIKERNFHIFGVFVLFIVCAFLGLLFGRFTSKVEYEPSKIVIPTPSSSYPEFTVKAESDYDYSGWLKYSYSEGDFNFMVPRTVKVKELKPSEGSPCKYSVYIYSDNNDTNIQINKCNIQDNRTHSRVFSTGTDGISTINLSGVMGYTRTGIFALYDGNNTAQLIDLYNNNFEYTIFRLLNNSLLTPEQFSQFLSSFKFAK